MFQTRKSGCDLALTEVNEPLSQWLGGVLGVPRINPQRTAMRREFLYIEQRQPVGQKYFLGGNEGKIREMLMINGVELVALHQAHQVRKFHRDDACGFKQNLHARDEIVEVGDLSKRVVA